MTQPDKLFTFTVDGIDTEYAKLMTALKDGVRPDIITVEPKGDAAGMSAKTYTRTGNGYNISAMRPNNGGGLAAHGANVFVEDENLVDNIRDYVDHAVQKGGARRHRRRSTQRHRNRRRRSTHRRR